MTVYSDIIQGTDEWNAIRAGKFTASIFSDLLMKETTKGYQDAINKVVFERITGESPESFSNNWMQRGTELEPIAIEQYELSTFNKVKRVGFIEISEWVGCSPDGLIEEPGMLQVKCPKYSTLISYHLDGKVPSDYYTQIQGELYVSGRQWSDFYVYHPKLKPLLKRIHRDEKHIAEIKSALDKAIELAEKRIKQIR